MISSRQGNESNQLSPPQLMIKKTETAQSTALQNKDITHYTLRTMGATINNELIAAERPP